MSTSFVLRAGLCRHTSSKPISKRHSTAPLMGSSLLEKVGLPIRMDLYFSSLGNLFADTSRKPQWEVTFS